jgi:hypothetical protein
MSTFHRPRQPKASLAHVAATSAAAFVPIPAAYAAGRTPPYQMNLSDLLPADEVTEITQAGNLVFHCLGDTGGVQNPAPQASVAQGLETAMQAFANDPGAAGSTMAPVFCYHIGDVVYFNGEVDQYYAQFYQPYEKYPLPIIGIPGNHDGAPLNASATSLEGFYRNFLATPGPNGAPVYTTESQDSGRPAMQLPFFYWTLLTPFATFIGLYTNVPEGGQLDADQRAWFQQQMAEADKTKALIVALHHPVYSFDTYHSGSATMAQELQDAINASGRLPNMVLTAHVHNYQRIELELAGQTIPFFVIGNGGYHNMHQLSAAPGYKDPETAAELVAAIDTQFGFMTFDISTTTINGHFTIVPKAGGSWSDPTGYNTSFDVFNYTAAPLFLPKGQTVTLVPANGSNVPPNTDPKHTHPPKRSKHAEDRIHARLAHAARTARKLRGH